MTTVKTNYSSVMKCQIDKLDVNYVKKGGEKGERKKKHLLEEIRILNLNQRLLLSDIISQYLGAT